MTADEVAENEDVNLLPLHESGWQEKGLSVLGQNSVALYMAEVSKEALMWP
jgi:hypothetical protein